MWHRMTDSCSEPRYIYPAIATEVSRERTHMNSNDSESAKIDLTSRIVDMWQIFGIEIRNQTDRGMAIVTAAFLEDELANTIKAHFVVNDDDTDALFASQSSLGSFDAKSR